MVIKDKAAAAATGRRVLERPIRVVVPCHGECVADDAHAALGRACRRCSRAESASGVQERGDARRLEHVLVPGLQAVDVVTGLDRRPLRI